MVRMTGRSVVWLGLAANVGVGCVPDQSDMTVTLHPGQDIQAVVEGSPEGARFFLQPGIYREQTIYPKHRQQFIGQDGVILSGAMELKTWRKQARIWTMAHLPPPLPSHGECDWQFCDLREDLFFNDRLYRRVGSLDELGPGQWLYENGRAHLADDPTGQSVELGVTPLAFGGDAEGVVLRNLIVEKYASRAQHGAIDARDGGGWVLADLTVRWNHGIGLYIGPATHVQGGSFSHNGQLGMGGIGAGSIIEGAEIAFNNYAGFDGGWEAGGTKFVESDGLIVRNSCIHDNQGPGLWTDFDNGSVLYEANKVFSNAGDGIKHEISRDAVIRNNIAAYNGFGWEEWLWGSQILIQNSYGVEVYGNSVWVSADEAGNGIVIIHQDRDIWNAVDNYVHHNTVVYLGDRGQSGAARDADEDWFWKEAGNRFDWNTYIAPDGTTEHWAFHDWSMPWNQIKELGYERNGKLIVEQRAPITLSCDQ
jgi:Right handed beta helix region